MTDPVRGAVNPELLDKIRNGPAAHVLIRPERCETCKFAVMLKKGEALECRRMPPVPTAFMVPGRNGGVEFPMYTAFPRVSGDNWCGEFRPKVSA